MIHMQVKSRNFMSFALVISSLDICSKEVKDRNNGPSPSRKLNTDDGKYSEAHTLLKK